MTFYSLHQKLAGPFTAQHFDACLEIALETLLHDVPSSRLSESIRYSVLSGGKRLRPLLLLETARALPFFTESSSERLNDTMNGAYWSAVSLELFHCFTLIHDDLPCMDNDDFRRGKPTNHKVFGEAMALLAGDLLQTLSVQAYAHANLSKGIELTHWKNGLDCLLNLWGAKGVMSGQAIEFAPIRSLDEVFRLHDLKTGALFRASIELPFYLAGQTHLPLFNNIQKFAHCFGRSFQIADDIDDLLQDSGKPTSIFSYSHEKKAEHIIQNQRSELQDSMASLPSEFNGIVQIGELLLEKLQIP